MATEEIKGLKELQAKLNSMRGADVRRITKRGISKMAQVIRKDMRAKTPKKTGAMRKNITYRVWKAKGGGYRGKVGPRGKAYYAAFLEFGTPPHIIPGKTGKKRVTVYGKVFSKVRHPGIKPKPFLRPAYEASKREAVDQAGKLMFELIEKALKK